MKRTPIERKTPIRRSGSLPRVTHLRGRSRKRASEDVERGKVLAALRVGHPRCQVPDCTRASQDGHEVLTRARGGSITDPANIRMICRTHHDFFHENPYAAEELGMMRHSWE